MSADDSNTSRPYAHTTVFMSGHSHWSGIKHKKAITDAKKAKIFTKAARLITLAAKSGGGNPDTNLSLRFAIDQARTVNMPKDSVERAVKRGTGELKDAAEIEEVTYEAYLPVRQPGGSEQIAMLIKTATDNKNRTLGDLKIVLSKFGGKIVPAGSVAYLFKSVGLITIPVSEGAERNHIEMQAIDAGAEDTVYADETLTVQTLPDRLREVQERLERHSIAISGSSLAFVPVQTATIDQETKSEYEKLLEALDEQDDVQEIFDNL